MDKVDDSKYVVLFITTEADEEAQLISRVLLEQRKAACINIVPEADEEAQLISRVLLEQRKAACINIVPEVSSLFWWKNNIDSARESLLVVKTKASLLDEIVQLVKRIHSNDVPEIIALPIVGGNRDYLDWVGKELEGEK